MFHIIWFIPITIVLLILIICLRTIILKVRTKDLYEVTTNLPFIEDPTRAANHLAEAVTFATIAASDWEKTDFTAFRDFQEFLKKTYAHTFSKLEVLDAGPYNIVLRWAGSETTLLPALLLAHQDVVPAADIKEWTYPPFSKQIKDGYVWGRGSFDAKGQLIAIMEALETLVEKSFKPTRTWYIAFGCDEEIRGSHGAAAIAQYFKSQNLRFAFVLDEGGVVAEGFIPILPHPVAVVGIAEKGDVNVKLTCNREGGHSSSPNNPTALSILGRAMWRLEAKQSRAIITTPVSLMLTTLGRHAPFLLAIPLLNLWLFKPLIATIFRKTPAMNALLRTTCAVTMAQASDTPNVIAKQAIAVANLRLLPNQTTEQTLTWMRRRINDKRVTCTPLEKTMRSQSSSIDGPEFALLTETIKEVFPSAIPTPYLMTGGTDAIWYEPLSSQVYRFTPAAMNTGELNRMHNRDERFSVENLCKATQFYMTLITRGNE
jgi:carboxypeptidase PM20D1